MIGLRAQPAEVFAFGEMEVTWLDMKMALPFCSFGRGKRSKKAEPILMSRRVGFPNGRARFVLFTSLGLCRLRGLDEDLAC